MYKFIYRLVIIILIIRLADLSIFDGFRWIGRCCETNVNISLPIEGLGARKAEGKCFCGSDCFLPHENNVGVRANCCKSDCTKLFGHINGELFGDCWKTCMKPPSPFQRDLDEMKEYCKMYKYYFIFDIPINCRPYVDSFSADVLNRRVYERLRRERQLKYEKKMACINELKRQRELRHEKKREADRARWRRGQYTRMEYLEYLLAANYIPFPPAPRHFYGDEEDDYDFEAMCS